MIRTLILLAGAIFGDANTATDVAACTSAMNGMVTGCASSGIPATPTAASIEGLCDVGLVPPYSGCGYELGKVAIECPTSSNVPTGVTINAADQGLIDAAKVVAECCMKSSTTYTTAAQALAVVSGGTAQESSADCWTGSGSNTVWTTDATKAAAIAVAVAPLGAAVAGGTLSVTGPTNSSTPGGNNGGNNGGNTANGGAGNAGGNSSNSSNTTAAPKSSSSDAGKTTLAMAVFAGVLVTRV